MVLREDYWWILWETEGVWRFLFWWKEDWETVSRFGGNMNHYVVFLFNSNNFFISIEIQVEFSLLESAFYFKNMKTLLAPDVEWNVFFHKFEVLHRFLKTVFEDRFWNIENVFIDDQGCIILKNRQIGGRNLNPETITLILLLFDNWHTISAQDSQIEDLRLCSALNVKHSNLSSCLPLGGCGAMYHELGVIQWAWGAGHHYQILVEDQALVDVLRLKVQTLPKFLDELVFVGVWVLEGEHWRWRGGNEVWAFRKGGD